MGEIFYFVAHEYQGGIFMTFQEIILTLQEFWSKQGCILAQPYDVEKGAGTMKPFYIFYVYLALNLGM